MRKGKYKDMERVVLESLGASYKSIVSLGAAGKEETGEVNEFGNATYKADIEAGRAVLEVLRKSGIAARVISEEHGKDIVLGTNPKYIVVLDELDGSIAYKKGKGMCGTMIGVFEGENPKYSDYVGSGILDYRERRCFLASKESGVHIVDIESGNKTKIRCSSNKKLDKENTAISIDGWFPINLEIANKLKSFKKLFIGSPENSGSSCKYYSDLISGKIDVVIECTRKRNLEIAAAYGLVREAGGVMVDILGRDLEKMSYLEFYQSDDKHFPIISAANSGIIRKLLGGINLSLLSAYYQ